MSAFDDAFTYVVGEEGGLSMNPKDRGNWTSGIVGQGSLKGTKYGISAMAYPNEDIANLTLDRAKVLYKQDYWDKVSGDDLPPGIGLGVFDAAVNQGIGEAAILLQKAAGVTADGVIGRGTIAAANAADPKRLAHDFTTLRIVRYTNTNGWLDNGRGWVGRSIDTLMRMIA